MMSGKTLIHNWGKTSLDCITIGSLDPRNIYCDICSGSIDKKIKFKNHIYNGFVINY